jgi:hypothetical protein
MGEAVALTLMKPDENRLPMTHRMLKAGVHLDGTEAPFLLCVGNLAPRQAVPGEPLGWVDDATTRIFAAGVVLGKIGIKE